MIMANITQYQVTNITQLCANCWKYETQTTAQLQLSWQNNAGSCLYMYFGHFLQKITTRFSKRRERAVQSIRKKLKLSEISIYDI